MRWVPPVESRDQLVLFPQKLDDSLPADHPVRQLDAILNQLDWSLWESKYKSWGAGRPPIHPRVMASILLYGILMRIRASRQLEDSLTMRLDFRWLAEGRSIDHTTLSEFRRKHHEQLQQVFVQVGLLAKAAGILKLEELAFDGTKIRANNSRSAKLKTDTLKTRRDELLRKYNEHVAAAERLDAKPSSRDHDSDDPPSPTPPSKVLDKIKSSLQEVQRALAEVDRLESSEEVVPKQLPTTDLECRVTPNKHGGFAPNYTPAAMVDTQSGLIVATQVIAGTNEKAMLPPALDQVQEDFNAAPQRVLADGIFSHSTNLAELAARGIELYSPVDVQADNPAIREDPTQPVPADQIENLPRKQTNGKKQFAKTAFVYDADQDVYFCPNGKRLQYNSKCVEKAVDGTQVESRRYQASPSDCQACTLQQRCITAKRAKFRQVQHDQFEPLRAQLQQRMASSAGREIYARRMAPGERPFAVIKRLMGGCQFLTRGLQNAKQEWRWLTLAFNLKFLMPRIGARAGPSPATAACPLPES